MATNDGGSAFPRAYIAYAVSCDGKGAMVEAPPPDEWPDGMSLRDWFAGHFLSGLLANREVCFEGRDDAKRLAKAVYAAADIMLEEREQADGQAKDGAPDMPTDR